MQRMSAQYMLRLPGETKKEMDEVPIKWPELLRRFIQDKIQEAKNRQRWKKIDRITGKHKRPPAGTCVRLIRELRDGA